MKTLSDERIVLDSRIVIPIENVKQTMDKIKAEIMRRPWRETIEIIDKHLGEKLK